ncbi:MAG TPA: CAAD domain-containing protein [Elainellaceae cyanobacterium]
MMDPEAKQDAGFSDAASEAEQVKVDIDAEDSGQLSKMPTDQTNEQWQKIGEQVSAFLADLPDYVGEFFGEYRRPIVTIGVVLSVILLSKVALAILGAINEIPLLAPTFELIGIGYTAWFIYRYILRDSSRKELSEDFESLKEQIVGRNDQEG